MTAQGAAGALAGAYKEDTNAVKKLTDQIKSWSGQHQRDALNVNEEEFTPHSIEAPPSGGGGMSPPRRMTSANGPSGWATMGGVLGSAWKSATGNSTLQKLVAMNTYVQQGSYMGGASDQAALNQAVGSGGGGRGNRYNWIANNTQDAMQQFQIMQQASGQQMLNSGPLGRAMMHASFAAGYINPGMSGTQSAQFGAQLYSPNTSLYMRQFGIAPLQQGGQNVSAQPATIALSILNKMTLGRGVSPSQIGPLMRTGGAGQASYQFVTGGQIPIQTMLPLMEVANKLQSQGVDQNKMNWAMSNAGHGNTEADKFLQKHNIPESDIIKMHKALAPNMARSADQYGGMQQGLSMATTAVQAFNTQFTKFMKASGLDQGVGAAAGFAGGINALEPGLGRAFGHLTSGVGSALLTKFLIKSGLKLGSKILGKVFPGLGVAAPITSGIGAAATGFFAAKSLVGHPSPHPGQHAPKSAWYKWMIKNIKSGELSPHAEKLWARNPESFISRYANTPNPPDHTPNVRGGGATAPPARPGGGQVTGADVVNYAKHFLGQPYQFGGGEGGLIPGRSGPFTDCSGLTYVVYKHLGIGDGMIPLANLQQHWVKKTMSPVVGGLVFFLGSDSPGPGQAGHVGIITGPNQMINDPHTGSVVSYAGIGGNLGYGVSPSSKFIGGGSVTPGLGGNPSGGGGTTTYTLPKGGNGPGGLGLSNGTGDDLTGGSVQEKAAFLSAITGGAHGGSGFYGNNNGSLFQVTVNGGGGPVGSGAPLTGAGGYVNPIPKGVRPERVDQGVDFAGNGPILAMGDAVIVETNGAGWPGGPYMAYQLTGGQFKGKFVYVAENIRPTVHVGQHVKAGQKIADMFDGGTGIETGWAAPGGASPLSQTSAAGGISGANLPGNGSTAIGMAFDRLLVSLGAPRAPNFGTPSGGRVPPGYSMGGDIEVHKHHLPDAPNEHTYSTLHPMYAGGKDLLPSNTQIILHFKANSIEFTVPPGELTGASNQSTMAKATNLVNTNTLRGSISKGVK